MADHTPRNQPTPPALSLLADAEIVDLTVTLDERNPVSWPGATPYQHHISNTYDPTGVTPTAQGPYVTHTLILDEHTGTHFDAPSHFIPPNDSGLPHAGPLGDVTGDRVPLRQLMGRAAVIDCRSLEPSVPGHSPIITPELIAADEARHGELRAGDAVLFWTGWADRTFRQRPEGDAYVLKPFMLQDVPAWAAPDVEAAQFLHSKGVRLLATDGTTMGPCQNGAEIHWWGLGNGMLFVEGCVGFERLPPRSAFFMFLPLKVARSSGGPGRAIGIIPGAER